jgi:hypothetical protein
VVGVVRKPLLGDGPLPERAQRYATQSLLRHYVGAVFATALLGDKPVRIRLDELIGGWGDTKWRRDVLDKLREVYGAQMMERFLASWGIGPAA